MATRSTQRPQINTLNQHDVLVWIKEQQKVGVLKRCRFLALETYNWSSNRQLYAPAEHFLPECEQRSFKWQTPPRNIWDEREAMIRYLHHDLFCCPKNCHTYKSQRIAKLTKPFRDVWKKRRVLLVPFRAFVKLAPMVQFIIVLLLIVILAPRLIPLLIQLAKALK